VNLNIDGVLFTTNFEVIEIVDGSKPYPTLLGLDRVFNNHTIIGLKKRQMIFEVAYLRVTAPLDPMEGRRYVEPKRGKELDNLYNVIMYMDDYINPTVEGVLI
jgi:hypothetical protein